MKLLGLSLIFLATFTYADCVTVSWNGVLDSKPAFARASAGFISNCPGKTSYIHFDVDKEQVPHSQKTIDKNNVQVQRVESMELSDHKNVAAEFLWIGDETKTMRLQLSGFKGDQAILNSNTIQLTMWADGRPTFSGQLNGSVTYESL
jgi:hypothetical protein